MSFSVTEPLRRVCGADDCYAGGQQAIGKWLEPWAGAVEGLVQSAMEAIRREMFRYECILMCDKKAYREALVEMVDTLVCDPVLPAVAAGSLIGLSDQTVKKYRDIIAEKLAS